MAQAGFEEVQSPAGIAGTLLRCAGSGTGVVVLGGSSGRVDVDRAKLFATQGATALALQWFGGYGQPPGICEVPLETFFSATDLLVELGCRRIVYVGTSKGAEAALLASVHDNRINAVVAISPSSVVWGNIGAGLDGVRWPERSSWSLLGRSLPFVPAIPNWRHDSVDGLVSYLGFFERCLAEFPRAAREAAIPVENAAADILIVAGGDDALWPSLKFGRAISARRHEAGSSARLVSDPAAGHRVLLPGENTPRSKFHAHGGNDEADTRLGHMAWERILELL